MDKGTPHPHRIIIVLTLAIQGALAIGFILFAVRQEWERAFLTLLVIGLVIVPGFLLRRRKVFVPSELQLIAASFVFLSLFLGSAADFYEKIWWWDFVLHLTSGVLLGMVGWLSLYLLNQTNRLPPGIKPVFLCFFGWAFAVTLGVVWEIYEFGIDSLLGKNMQRRETGVVDTMHDLITNAAGAAIVALASWCFYRGGSQPFLVGAIRTFVRKNPRLFRTGRATRKRRWRAAR